MSSEKMPACPFCGSRKVKKIDDYYQCENCRRDYGRDAVSDDDVPLTDAVQEIRFRYGDTISGNVRLRVRKDGFEVYDSKDGGADKVTGSMDEKEWKKLLKELFEELFIQDWDAEYLPVNDGKTLYENNSWELVYAVSEDEQHRIQGVDAYPPYWKQLMKIFDPLFQKLEKN